MANAYQTAFEALALAGPAPKNTRYGLIARYGFAIPSDADISYIAARGGRRGIVEIGAGFGLWAELIDAAGTTCIATDADPPVNGQTWKYCVGDTTRDDTLATKFRNVTARDAAAEAGRRITVNRTLLSVHYDYQWDFVGSYGGDRVIVVHEGTVGDPNRWDWHSEPLTAEGFALVDAYDKTLFWPTYPDRVETWER